LVDPSIYDELINPYSGSWEVEDLWSGYGAAPTSLIVTQNEIEFSIIPAPVSRSNVINYYIFTLL
jgi:hypothetical protein